MKAWERIGSVLGSGSGLPPVPGSPAAPSEPRPAAAAVWDCRAAAPDPPAAGSGSDPGRAPAAGLAVPELGVLGDVLDPPRLPPLPPTPALSPHGSASYWSCRGAGPRAGQGAPGAATPPRPLPLPSSTRKPETVSAFPLESGRPAPPGVRSSSSFPSLRLSLSRRAVVGPT